MENIKINYVEINKLKKSLYNPRRWSETALDNLKQSIKSFGICDPAIVNMAPGREYVLIGGHMRMAAAKALGYKEMPCVFLNIPDLEKEKELNIRLNKNQGEFNNELLAEFDQTFLANIGFSSEDLDSIFEIDETPEEFDLQRELDKLDIKKIEMQKGDIWDLDGSRMMVGDSTIEADVLKLMGDEKADMCFTDPPYILDYLNAKRHGKPTEGFGAKRNRRYLETDVLPDDFTELWMANIAKVQKESFSIICYENWKNIPTIWEAMKKHWKIKNMIVWHLPNRNQGFAARHKFFSKHDIALVGASLDRDIEYNLDNEKDGLQNEYETALYAISGNPQWEGYKKGNKICPTDFIDFNAADEKSSGQGIIFGTKPIEILIPYIKVLTKRADLIIEPFGGSGSTLIAATKMRRRCFLMEKSCVYAEVIRNRWEKLTGKKAVKIKGKND
jgi:DNA modification methylase